MCSHGDYKTFFFLKSRMGCAHHLILCDESDNPVDYVFLDVNPAFESLTGLRRDGILNRKVTEVLPEIKKDDFDWIGAYGSIALNGGEEEFIRHSIPLQRWYKIHVFSPERLYFTTMITDITSEINAESERLDALGALTKSELKYRNLFNQSIRGIYLHTLGGTITDVNARATLQSGYSREELMGKSIFSLISPCQFLPGASEAELLAAWKEWKAEEYHFSEVELKNKNNVPYAAEISSGKIILNGEELFMTHVEDVTEDRLIREERDRMENQIIQLQKIDSLGQLTSGIAHDFNNQLSGILGFAELLEDSLQEPLLRHFARSIVSGARNGAKLTKLLLSYSRASQNILENLDILQIIEEVMNILRHTIRKSIQITLQNSLKQTIIQGNRGQIQNALLNLGINARDAIDQAGTIIFGARPCPPELVKNQFPDLAEGDYIQISVQDSGCGIAEENLEKIFEPFFTTKIRGRGTGLGLSSTISTIKNHGGDIQVTSSLGRGTTFTMVLPLCQSGETPNDEIEEPWIFARHPAFILIVDDELSFQGLLKEFLLKIGYEASCSQNGQDALDYLTSHEHKPDLMLIDINLPLMGGVELIRHIRTRFPQIKLLVSSGYSREDDRIKEILALGASFIQKPECLGTYSVAVDEALYPLKPVPEQK